MSAEDFVVQFKETLDELLGGLSVQARSLSHGPLMLRSLVADALLPP